MFYSSKKVKTGLYEYLGQFKYHSHQILAGYDIKHHTRYALGRCGVPHTAGWSQGLGGEVISLSFCACWFVLLRELRQDRHPNPNLKGTQSEGRRATPARTKAWPGSSILC